MLYSVEQYIYDYDTFMINVFFGCRHTYLTCNNNPRSTSTVCAQAARVTGLKKNGKERNKLHLTLTLNGSESGNSTSGAPQYGKDEDVVLAGDLPGNPQGGNKKRAVVSDGDENYTQ